LGDTRPNLVKAIGPARRRGSAQAVLCSAKKLSGGSASSGVNRGSKRKRVPQLRIPVMAIGYSSRRRSSIPVIAIMADRQEQGRP
jgi:hypothetical protein